MKDALEIRESVNQSSISGLIKALRNMENEHGNLEQIILRFLKHAASKVYGSQFTVQVNEIIKHLAKHYSSYENVDRVVFPLKSFLRIEDASVQMAAVDCLCCVFDHETYDKINSSELTQIHKELFESLKISELECNDDDLPDHKNRVIAIHLQLYCAIIGKCACLRNIGLWEFIHFCCYKSQIPRGTFIMVD